MLPQELFHTVTSSDFASTMAWMANTWILTIGSLLSNRMELSVIIDRLQLLLSRDCIPRIAHVFVTH